MSWSDEFRQTNPINSIRFDVFICQGFIFRDIHIYFYELTSIGSSDSINEVFYENIDTSIKKNGVTSSGYINENLFQEEVIDSQLFVRILATLSCPEHIRYYLFIKEQFHKLFLFHVMQIMFETNLNNYILIIVSKYSH